MKSPQREILAARNDYLKGMEYHDDDLIRFESEGAPALPAADLSGYIEHDGARIWYSAHGSGKPVLLLHGGLGHSGNWGHQVRALVSRGYRVVLMDTRGHGRSSRDERPYSYDILASDAQAVIRALRLGKVALVGWSDGACTALVLAAKSPETVAGVFYFACNMDPSGVRENIEYGPMLERCLARHVKDYEALSESPDRFKGFSEAVSLMQKAQPDYSASDLASIAVPTVIAQAEFDEFIKPEHAQYLSQAIPGAKLVLLKGVSHFAPLQRPDLFNHALFEFLSGIW